MVNTQKIRKIGILLGDIAIIIIGLFFTTSMVMCSILLFIQTRDRIYIDFQKRLYNLEVIVYK